MTHVYPVVALTLLTVSLANASFLCTWTKVLSNSEVHYSFLRGDGGGSLRLYHSIWSSPGTMQSCSFSDNKTVIRKYTTLCRENKQAFSHQLDLSFDYMFDEQCTSLDSLQNAPHEEHSFKRRLVRSTSQDALSKPRVKRGFIVPGTLWCGSGNKAPSYSDLGTDKCCREHDQCQDTILSFHSKFGVFNSNIFTMSHCDCDNRFRSCLKEAQDSISDVVGYTFFNLLKMHCFEFSYRLQCTERNWFGMCKETKMALYAEVHAPTLYVTDTLEDVNSTSLNMTTMSTPVYNITEPLYPIMLESTSPTQTISIMPTTDTPLRATTVLPTRAPKQSVPLSDAYITERQKSCAVFKYLDECENRILPLQRKYGFHSNEPRTMYHCNCTNRLFQSLAAHPTLTEVKTLLLDHVSQSCFVLQDCTAGQICKVVAVGTQLSQEATSSAHVKEQRHLQAMRLNVRRPTLNKATKDRSTRLHRLCLRMALPQIHKRRRNHTKETNKKKQE
ncbi:group 3 secretory phospholipase A2 isoform X2 [Boleophthalmus pectinirostris]|uniref:group 3 secretory phospholipase A2 isoform X2 n=1 Tax=Boleophthalmus pectinirostris TaxID=150288 RepID=UPI00242F965E|nr:group 3 secretory phospholipase A2 isoform X2 [Boleophthalmus pectinirostris]